MTGRGIDWLRVARGRAVAAAVIRRAKVRAAFDDLAWNLDLRQARIVALLFATAARIFGATIGLSSCRPRGVCVKVIPVMIGDALPGIRLSIWPIRLRQSTMSSCFPAGNCSWVSHKKFQLTEKFGFSAGAP